MTARNYDACFKAVLRFEGGFVNDPQDPGGPTNFGITQRVYAAFKGRDVSVDEVRQMPLADAAAIFRPQYWNSVRGDDLPSGLDEVLFDYSTNSGPAKAIKSLQNALGVDSDGQIGMVTMDAVQRTADIAALINDICDRRLSFMQGLPTFPRFGRGWTSRVEGVRTLALRLAAS